MMNKKLLKLLALFFCLGIQIAKAGDVPHLVGGTVRLEDGSTIESIQFNAYIFSRPAEVLTETSLGCGYEDGYYWIQCSSFLTDWDSGDLLIVNLYDINGHSEQKDVTLTYASVDTLNFILPFTRYTYKIQTQPAGLPCWIDGIEQITPVTFSWLENSVHTLSVVSPQLETNHSRYVFNSWSHGETQDHSITATSNTILTANFVPEYKLFFDASPAAGGSVVADPLKIWYSEGESVQIEALPDNQTGYLFDTWSGDTTTSTNPLTFSMDKSYSVTANFQVRGIKVHTNTTPANGGFVVLNPYKEAYVYGDTLSIFAVANDGSGYFFNEWTGDVTGFQNPVEIVLYEDLFVTAVFLAQRYTLKITVEPYGSGSVDLIPYSTNFAYGDTVFIKAFAREGYKFFFWEGDHFGLENPDTLIIKKNMNITANFRVDTDVENQAIEKPEQYKLLKNYPNPFNASTRIPFEMPENGHVNMTIYNTLGHLVFEIKNQFFQAGCHEIIWNGCNRSGELVESGIYILQFQCNHFIQQEKMILLK